MLISQTHASIGFHSDSTNLPFRVVVPCSIDRQCNDRKLCMKDCVRTCLKQQTK